MAEVQLLMSSGHGPGSGYSSIMVSGLVPGVEEKGKGLRSEMDM